MSMNSEAGVLSLELLKQKLLREEGEGGQVVYGRHPLATAAAVFGNHHP